MKNFTDLTLDEKKEVLKWRNHPEIRKWMFDKNEISLKNHLEFIEKLKNDKSRLYFKVNDLGVINFKINKNSAEIGIHKNPEKKGVGKILIKKIIDYGFNMLNLNKLILYVYEDNLKAINLYKKYGFKETDKKNNLIKMELENENRKN
ncbi:MULTISPECIES: UDP-4-amino-4,6-dideoxy-N-acetyl-beta-L-altrosamine N-acetyltransferase [unclassified Lebetimonas]|uniref:UDP-4-amino-4, 6-dideoxy-N-acetyl-beta-L-altrosamine N-acetyltransferase n=1 Tax=unclassified Lebetimonas TaxID=2648158 RepID=UPI000464E070|nr:MULTISPECIES: UDP-4-amino-4,6-dideoxy-N-acetyl-beta-L-altrosamine N-acetyltransferase [unclassified Lebetimonas]